MEGYELCFVGSWNLRLIFCRSDAKLNIPCQWDGQLLNEKQVSSRLHGHGPWPVCKVVLIRGGRLMRFLDVNWSKS
jgi:hypothetical protein